MRFPTVRFSGPLADLASELRSELLRQGYTILSCRNLLYLASHLSRWLQGQGLGLHELFDEQIDLFFRARRAEGYTQFLTAGTLAPIRRFLTEAGLVPVPEPKPPTPQSPLERLLSEYEGSLLHDRGLTSVVAERYRTEAQQLVVKTSPSGLDLSSLDGATIKRYVLESSQGSNLERTRAMLTGLRSFLRFLLLRGDIAQDLRGAVPKVAGWRMASLPRYLTAEQVNAIVGSCDRRSTLGRRDFAILLLLARMGLRAKEVAALSLDDLDWNESVLLVRGKGGRVDPMPLPTEVGSALASYLRRRRKTTWRAVFLGHRAPHGPLGSRAVVAIVRRACSRAQIPPVGAHRLRHSAATTMLRKGATLEEISQVLRHRNHMTTAIYAKVDHLRSRAGAEVAWRCLVSKLHQILDDYLATPRAMGYKLQHADRRLLQFIESVLDEGSDFITTELALQWATTPVGTSTKWWATRLSMIRQFALYAQAFDPRTEVPPHHLIPYSSRRPTPYIYSKDDIERLLEAARRQRDRLSAATDPTLFGLIAVTGMRVGEAIRLDRRDLDHDRALLTVRDTKYGKSRQLPLHPSTVEALDRYRRNRDRRIPLQYSSALFLSRSGKPMFYSNVHRRFHRLIDRAGLAEAGRRRPRIHDLRHTFAVRTLLGWYRAGLEVEPRLPLLSTYLGHINPAMTYWYLSAVPELLLLVSERCRRSEVGS